METLADQYRAIKWRLSAVTPEADAEAKAILAHVYGLDFSALVMRFLHEAAHGERVREVVAQRLAGVPLAYVLRGKNFYGYDFYVDPSVLIPRSDTEQAVEFALYAVRARGYQTVLDLCCGSGCIGLALLMEEPGLKRVYFSDISSDALRVARCNAARLKQNAKSVFLQGDLFEPVDMAVDMIVCNPPYIGPEEYAALEPGVRDFEPRLALFAEHEGYAFYERLAQESGPYLKPGGMVVFEIGCTQYEITARLLKTAGFDNIKCGFDLAGRPRFVSATK